MKPWKTFSIWTASLGLGLILNPANPTLAQPTDAKSIHLAQTQPAPSPTPADPDVPYVPTPIEVVTEMLKLASVKEGDVLYDLGSGDGRLVIEAVQKLRAQRGVGIEINPKLVKESQENAQKAGVSDRAKFLQQDLFQTNIRDATVVTLYLLPQINIKLRPKLLDELKPGTRVVSHAFDMDEWKPDKTIVVRARDRQRILYYWVIPAKVAGTWRGTLTTASGQKQPYTLQLTQEFQQARGVLNINGQKINVSNIKLVGDRMSFKGTQSFFGKQIKLQFDGKVAGNSINGAAELRDGNSTKKYGLSARRV